ncbi:MAG: 3-oxoacid CoA-transferase subunit A, partial [Chloroflexi bacterium]|nr:3-oxoacid CoA-transferase subunit A [Chloroflexota bacterium]
MVATVYETPDAALDGVEDGATVMVGGFVSAGSPSNLILALKRRGTRGLTAIANNIGLGDKLDELCEERQLARVIASFAIRASGGRQSRFEQQYHAHEVELELVPQGTLAERIRAGGAGIGGFLTRTALGTPLAEGKRELEVDGERYLLERPLRADVALIKAQRADRLGNLVYRQAGRNFNPVMAT